MINVKKLKWVETVKLTKWGLLFLIYNRTSTVKKHKRDTFEKKQQLREHKKSIKEQSKAIIESRKLEKQLKREREAENKKRKEENAKKSEIVQVVRKFWKLFTTNEKEPITSLILILLQIRNTSKLKKAKRKQLRQIETRDTTVVEKAE